MEENVCQLCNYAKKKTLTPLYNYYCSLSALYQRFQSEKVNISSVVVKVSEENGGGPFC